MPKNKITVRINGSEYILTGDEKEDYLFSIANYVDKKIKEIANQNTKHSTTSAAVLGALTIADELYKARAENAVLKERVNEPMEKYEAIVKKYQEMEEKYKSLVQEHENIKTLYQESLEENENIKNNYESSLSDANKKEGELERLVKENAFLKENNCGLEKQIEGFKMETNNLKDELFENQLEIIRLKKDFKELRDVQNKKSV